MLTKFKTFQNEPIWSLNPTWSLNIVKLISHSNPFLLSVRPLLSSPLISVSP